MVFTKFMFDIASQFYPDDLKHMKFLCRKKMRANILSNIKTGPQLIDILEKQRLITENNVSFLYRLLKDIDRDDLCASMEGETGILVNSDLEYFHDSEFEFQEVLLEISRRMTPSDLEGVRNICGVKGVSWQDINLGIEVFSIMMEQQLLGPSNLDELISCLECVGRNDLLEKLLDFKEALLFVDDSQDEEEMQEQCAGASAAAVRLSKDSTDSIVRERFKTVFNRDPDEMPKD